MNIPALGNMHVHVFMFTIWHELQCNTLPYQNMFMLLEAFKAVAKQF